MSAPLYTARGLLVNTLLKDRGFLIGANAQRIAMYVGIQQGNANFYISPFPDALVNGGIVIGINGASMLLERSKIGDVVANEWYWYCTSGNTDLRILEIIQVS